MQIILVITAPHILRLIIIEDKEVHINVAMEAVRIMPYAPNFNKIPARIIEPATGAST